MIVIIILCLLHINIRILIYITSDIIIQKTKYRNVKKQTKEIIIKWLDNRNRNTSNASSQKND